MSLGTMSPHHPRWKEFYDLLQGPQGCNFRRKKADDPSTTRWDCKGGMNTDLAEKILAKMGATSEEARAAVKIFAVHGGFCDCEILFNVEASYKPSKRYRRRGGSK